MRHDRQDTIQPVKYRYLHPDDQRLRRAVQQELPLSRLYLYPLFIIFYNNPVFFQTIQGPGTLLPAGVCVWFI